jgi:hypothetical protein
MVIPNEQIMVYTFPSYSAGISCKVTVYTLYICSLPGHAAGISRKAIKLKPIAVIKG